MLSSEREFEFTRQDFDFLRKFSNDRTGIVVTDDKEGMFYSRLSRRLRQLGLKNFKEYCQLLQTRAGKEETVQLINAITTNLTAFFREKHHFEYLKDRVIPEFRQRNRSERSFKIWSAGCSTGEEPYSLAMVLNEAFADLPTWDIKVLATDIDSNVLEQAATGIYRNDRVTDMPINAVKENFKRGKGKQSGLVRAKSSLRKLIGFSQLNLMDAWSVPTKDVIFCRNVIIYFDKETKKRLIDRYADTLRDGGYLFIGHSESLIGASDRFKLIRQTIYRKVG